MVMELIRQEDDYCVQFTCRLDNDGSSPSGILGGWGAESPGHCRTGSRSFARARSFDTVPGREHCIDQELVRIARTFVPSTERHAHEQKQSTTRAPVVRASCRFAPGGSGYQRVWSGAPDPSRSGKGSARQAQCRLCGRTLGRGLGRLRRENSRSGQTRSWPAYGMAGPAFHGSIPDFLLRLTQRSDKRPGGAILR